MQTGLLIVFEGIDGSGKSTQVALLAAALRQRFSDVITTREPTQGPHGMELRRSAASGRHDARREAELFLLDRREHVESLISPGLSRGAIILCDRYYLSTVAYQGARGLERSELLRQNQAIAPAPDLALFIDVPVEDALTRIRQGRGGRVDDFERSDLLARSRQIYLELCSAFPFFQRIDGSAAPGSVHAQVLSAVNDLLPE
ncbi:MAG: dTMP kinase [Myxococcota bacterium]|jgi:dTMP kinase|nr:dTMP kinase [Myxococcota bacterium]